MQLRPGELINGNYARASSTSTTSIDRVQRQ